MFKKNFIFFILLLFLVTSCSSNDWSSVKRGLTGSKGENTDEFLVKKKDPLILPPDFEDLPTPGDRRTIKQEVSIFEESLGQTVYEEETTSGSIEESILRKIRKN